MYAKLLLTRYRAHLDKTQTRKNPEIVMQSLSKNEVTFQPLQVKSTYSLHVCSFGRSP